MREIISVVSKYDFLMFLIKNSAGIKSLIKLLIIQTGKSDIKFPGLVKIARKLLFLSCYGLLSGFKSTQTVLLLYHHTQDSSSTCYSKR